MPPSEGAGRYRSTALDRALAPARTVVTVGPLDGLTEDEVRAVLDAVQRSSDTPRLALIPDADDRTWRYGDGFCADVVTSRPDLATDDPADLVTAVRNRPGEREPLEVLICGDHLLLDYSHGVGDGQLGVLGLAILAGADDSLAPTLANGLPPAAVWTGLWRHYRSKPSALRDFWRLRKAHDAVEVVDAPTERRILDWEAAKCSVGAYLDPAGVDRLRTWAKSHWAGATTASVTVSLWLAALRAEGVQFDDRVMILINCRRYLGDEHRTSQGNFAVGIPIAMPRSGSPGDIAALVRQVVESGWPLAILGMAEVKSLLRRRRSAEPPGADGTVVVPDRLRLAVSDLGRLGMFDGVTWKTGRPPRLSAFLEPDGADALTLLVDELAGGRTFTASFCSKMIEPAVVERALARMCDDPAGLATGR